jgi:transcriptional regulator of acetoin/glycerol metabolism
MSKPIFTRKHRLPTDEHEPAGEPTLLCVFPGEMALSLPTSSAPVGRDWLAEHGCPDDEVSAAHLSFRRHGATVEVEDAGSTNGTHVDGQLLSRGERVRLVDGSVLRIGRTLFVFREAFRASRAPQLPLGSLVAPWGLAALRAELDGLARLPVRNVLVLGESGSGKQLVAEEIARRLGRPLKQQLNVAAIPADRLEAELFGWERGAFSGAVAASPGLARACDGGVLFLDELGELSLHLQSKLLRFLERGEVQPLGSSRVHAVDVCVVAATNRRLEEEVEEGRFRLDLFARFPLRLSLPRLAERAEDTYSVFRALFDGVHGAGRLARARVDVEAVELLLLHDWPANVRDVDRLARAVEPDKGLRLSSVRRVLGVPVAPKGEKSIALTRVAVEQALRAHQGNQTHAAASLAVSRATLRRAMKKLELK